MASVVSAFLISGVYRFHEVAKAHQYQKDNLSGKACSHFTRLGNRLSCRIF